MPFNTNQLNQRGIFQSAAPQWQPTGTARTGFGPQAAPPAGTGMPAMPWGGGGFRAGGFQPQQNLGPMTPQTPTGFRNYSPTAQFDMGAAVPRDNPVTPALANQSMAAAGNVGSPMAMFNANMPWAQNMGANMSRQLATSAGNKQRAAGMANQTRLGMRLATEPYQMQLARDQMAGGLGLQHGNLTRQNDQMGRNYQTARRNLLTMMV